MKIKAIEKKSYIFIYRRPKYSKTSEMSLNITHIPQNSYKEHVRHWVSIKYFSNRLQDIVSIELFAINNSIMHHLYLYLHWLLVACVFDPRNTFIFSSVSGYRIKFFFNLNHLKSFNELSYLQLTVLLCIIFVRTCIGSMSGQERQMVMMTMP